MDYDRRHGHMALACDGHSPWEMFAHFRKVRHTQAHTIKKENTTGCMDDLNSMYIRDAVYTLHVPRWVLFLAKELQLVSQQRELSMDSQTA